LCAAAGSTPELVGGAEGARVGWRRAACVLVGDDLADEVAALNLARRSDVVLVAVAPGSARLWQCGVALHADDVVTLPDADSWLVGRLSDCLDASSASCLTVGITGARGGAGATTLAAALATTAARQGISSLLIDADPLSGGIDLVLGCEDVDGLHWPQVASTHGRVSSTALRAALPKVGDLAVLSWDRGADLSVDSTTMSSILSAGRRGSELIVVDLPRYVDDPIRAALMACDVIVVITTADVRGAAAASRLLGVLRPQCPDVRLVVRHRGGFDLGGEALSEALQVTLLETIPTKRAVERSIDEGFGPPRTGQLQGRCVDILEKIGLTGAPR
jgi:secretion/DNA translocation related CpaE-like protein